MIRLLTGHKGLCYRKKFAENITTEGIRHCSWISGTGSGRRSASGNKPGEGRMP
ncbi:MAG: hypothetical protein HPY66_0802 [Firmicutes bacterium]|nr:hypothetical protein [Bacillota bacterium]